VDASKPQLIIKLFKLIVAIFNFQLIYFHKFSIRPVFTYKKTLKYAGYREFPR